MIIRRFCLLFILIILTTGCQPPFPEVEPAWITYTNQEYGYEFKYPGTVRVEITLEDASQVKVHAGVGDPFQVIVKIDYSPGDVLYYLDTAAIGERTIGENTWSEYVLPDGYCDATVCSPPLYALQMESRGILFTVTFYSQKSTTELQEKILGTFKISDKP
ncbi:MAG: hypothetical protein L0287_01845 [Anaerolineae bacterium]|nr:hypothetical protein [Anaerolineae bacterium]MCI0607470.1 hypothetical protein [Anaerolineae bacterium]